MIGLAPPTPREILETFRAATRMPSQAQLDALLARGLSSWALAGTPNSGELGIAFAVIELIGDARFDFSERDGERAMLVPAINEFGEVADIVAATRSGFLGSWLGECQVLGLRNAYAPRVANPAVAVHQTLTGWLKAERSGLLIISPKRAAAALADLDPFAVENVEHGLKLQSLLMPRMPKILVPDVALRSAA